MQTTGWGQINLTLRFLSLPGDYFSKKGAARGMCGARPSSAFQLVLVADCEETEYHERGVFMRVSLDSGGDPCKV